MAKIYINISKTGVANWAPFDADLLGGHSYEDIKTDYQNQIDTLSAKIEALENEIKNYLKKNENDTVTARVKFDDLSGRLVLPVGSNKYATS